VSREPFISILIPSYNRPEELRGCLDSVFSQSYQNYEVIVSDDNSPKKELIKQVARDYRTFENVKFVFYSSNAKEPGNKNRLIAMARGDFNIILGDDDRLLPGALIDIGLHIQRNPQVDFFGLGYQVVDSSYDLLRSFTTDTYLSLDNTRLIRDLLRFNFLPMAVFHPSTFCCRRGLESRYPYRGDVGIGEDLQFLYDISLSGANMAIMPSPKFQWRKVEAGREVVQTNQSSDSIKCVEAKTLILRRLAETTPGGASGLLDFNSIAFRTTFLYREAYLRRLALGDVEVLMGESWANEYARYKRYKLRVVVRVFDICRRALGGITVLGLRGFVRFAMKMFFRISAPKLKLKTN